MNKVLALSLCFVTLCSFMCSKEETTLQARTTNEVEVNAHFDFTNLPASSTFTIIGNQGQGTWNLKSDSLKMYSLAIPSGTYRITWKIINVTKDLTKVAAMTNTNAEVTMPWATGQITASNWQIHGSYTFVQRKR